jgi:CubicO group peptidase (beta-lactamase class C family)
MADLEAGIPLTANSVFYLASVSKQFTSATIALLTLDALVSLDDDIRRYFPELPEYEKPVTLRHMVHHTSGLRDYLALMTMAGMSHDMPHEPARILELVARQEGLNFPPGNEYLYSNTGYFLIPLIVERVTGMSVKEFAQARVFGPLAMANSHFHDDHRHRVENRAYSYERAGPGFELSFLPRFDQVGSGGVLSTVEDLVKWDQNLYLPAVGGQRFLDLMHMRGVLNDGDTIPYAFGLRAAEYKGQRTVGHGGSMMGFKTHMVRFPELRFTVICLCNLGDVDPGRLALEVADVYLEDEFADHLRPFAGRYYSRELDTTWSIDLEGPDLFLAGPEDGPHIMHPRGADSFRVDGSTVIEFLRDEAGAVAGFEVNAGRVKGVRFLKR